MSQRNSDQEERRNVLRLVAFMVSLAVVVIVFTLLALPEDSEDGVTTTQPSPVTTAPETSAGPTTVAPTDPVVTTDAGPGSTAPAETTSTSPDGTTTTTMDVTDTSFDHTDTTGP